MQVGSEIREISCVSLTGFQMKRRQNQKSMIPASFVEIPRFELGQTEPKSVVLPLHHISIPAAKLRLFYFITKSEATREAKKGRERLKEMIIRIIAS